MAVFKNFEFFPLQKIYVLPCEHHRLQVDIHQVFVLDLKFFSAKMLSNNIRYFEDLQNSNEAVAKFSP